MYFRIIAVAILIFVFSSGLSRSSLDLRRDHRRRFGRRRRRSSLRRWPPLRRTGGCLRARRDGPCCNSSPQGMPRATSWWLECLAWSHRRRRTCKDTPKLIIIVLWLFCCLIFTCLFYMADSLDYWSYLQLSSNSATLKVNRDLLEVSIVNV